MRIAQVCPYDYYRPGGVQSHIRGLAGELRRRGHQVEVLAPRGGRTGQEVGVRHVGRCLRLPFSHSQIDLGAASWGELSRLRSYDLVHYHTFWNPILPWQLRGVLRAPSLATFHDVAPPTAFGKMARHVLMPVLAALIARFCMQAVVTVSPATRRYVSRFYRGPVYPIPNGIAVGDFRSEAGDSEILYLGRLERRKGVAVLLEAFRHLDLPGVSLTIAGDGPLRRALEAQATGLAKVRFLGEVDEPAKLALLARCTLLCAPSLYGESFGVVLAEAMASGKPPVAAANEGYRTVLTGPLARLLVPPGDARALADRLTELLLNPDLCAELGQQARRQAQRYDWSVVADELERVYARLVA